MKKQLYIVKIGGNVVDNLELMEGFINHFEKLPFPKLLVHGGGKLATRLSEKLGIESKLIEGRRITSKEELEIVTMVYAGKVNKELVAKLQAKKINALGFTGADANILVAKKRPVKEIDYGFVGDVEKVNTEFLTLCLENKIVPVCSAITHDGNGQLFNTNADTIAKELAVGLSENFEVNLMYCFEKKGVLLDANDDDSVIPIISETDFGELKAKEIISTGMIPKLTNSFEALQQGVTRVMIGNTSMLSLNNSTYTLLKL
ncbi:acetylglutamate kinase [Bernardetia sp.]|uniref:acetylglutamate kinase n=1 Tax=Bernardetia sp. TaxID=1937974 RepID=UPI0025B91F44|nr:acetylglutamate kinase [Bernardetia sp.]